MSKLCIGTAQWGSKYGISNLTGQTGILEARKILFEASAANVNSIDTADSYGIAQDIIGDLGAGTTFQVIAKFTAPRNANADFYSATYETIKKSMQRMRCDRIYGLLAHSPSELLGLNGQKLWNAMEKAKAEGHVEKLGVSVYTPEELNKIRLLYPLELVQVPLNIFDQRFLQCDYLERLSANGVEVHVRSVFLQGLLLMPTTDLSNYFSSVRIPHREFNEMLKAEGWSPLEGVLGFCLAQKGVSRVVIGCQSISQFKEIIEAQKRVCGYNFKELKKFNCVDENIILPTRWPN
jgi:aryl-alcohol dehydrogenase-like predicted oxidoreductase